MIKLIFFINYYYSTVMHILIHLQVAYWLALLQLLLLFHILKIKLLFIKIIMSLKSKNNKFDKNNNSTKLKNLLSLSKKKLPNRTIPSFIFFTKKEYISKINL